MARAVTSRGPDPGVTVTRDLPPDVVDDVRLYEAPEDMSASVTSSPTLKARN